MVLFIYSLGHECDTKFNNVESKVKRIGSKTPQVWLGIENNKETEDDEDNNQDI